MNWEALKDIYRAVLIHQWKIQYNGDDKYTFMDYYFNGNKWWKREYQNGKRHGTYQGWWNDGSVYWKTEYREGKKIK